MNPHTTVVAAINRLYLRSEIAFEASTTVDRPDFADQGEDYLTIAWLLEGWYSRNPA